jgi:hypothetical protein
VHPLECLFERDALPRFGLPSALTALYGGDFGLARPAIYANFVASSLASIWLAARWSS